MFGSKRISVDRSVPWLGYAFVLLLFAFCLTAGALLYLWQRQQWTQLAFRLEQLRTIQAQLEEELHPLDAEVGYLSRPQRVADLAKKMGLKLPLVSQYEFIGDKIEKDRIEKEKTGDFHDR